MKIIMEKTLENFEAWSGAINTKNIIIEANKCDEFEYLIEELYPEGLTETELNDLLWFESDWLFESLDINIED